MKTLLHDSIQRVSRLDTQGGDRPACRLGPASLAFSAVMVLAVGLIGFCGCGNATELVAPILDSAPEPVAPILIPGDGTLQLRGIAPSSGPVDQETVVLLEGSGFVNGMTVRFGDVAAVQVQVYDDTRAAVLVPSLVAGTVDVSIEDNGSGATLSDAFAFFLLPPEDGTDTDGDGLTDHQELKGWPIRVDPFGWGLDPGFLGNEFFALPPVSPETVRPVIVVYTARSNPNDPDSDDDGLGDFDEFIVRSDARLRDTDGDGLWDGEEVFRWLTSPVSVDSDGDARSPDPSSAFASLPPNPSLFDGAELYDSAELQKAPADRGPIKFNATSPTLADTDGDNVRDTDEIDTPVRTPLLADMPQLIFEIVDSIDIRLDVEYAEEEGKSTAFETSFTTAESRSQSESQSNTVSASVTVGVEVGFGPLDFGGASVETTAGYEHSWESTVESTVSSEQTSTQIEEKSRTNTETSATGSMTAGVKVTNIGNITVQVTDLGFTVRRWQPNIDPGDDSPGEYSTFAALGVDLGPGLTLSPGADSGVLLASAEDVNADRIKAFLAKPDALQIEPAAFELVNDEGFNFAFIEEVTRARTARVSIDFGDGRFEEYRIATNVDRNADGTLAGINIAKVLDLTVGPGNWETQSVVDPCAAQPPNLVSNGSFEIPDLDTCGCPGSGAPEDWVADTSDESVLVFVKDEDEGYPPAPDGDQWLNFIIPDDGDYGAVFQQIGVVHDNSVLNYLFTGGRYLGLGGQGSISIWAGDPTAGGVLLDEALFDADDPSLLESSGAFNTGAGNAGAPLYVRFEVFAGVGGMWYVVDDIVFTQSDVLWRVRDVETELDDTPRFWSVFLAGENTSGGLIFADTVLHNGDSVLIALTKDEDGDGIYAAQEQQYGSSDLTADSDGDGLTDPEEAAREYVDQGTCQTLEGGWIVQVTLRDGSMIDFRVYSDPRKSDSDGDGVDDLQEKIDGTNPNSRDTDQDGLTDDVDPRPTIQAGILYVLKGNPSGAGTSWGTAFGELSEGMDAAIARNSDGDETNDISEIWVSSGAYDLSAQALPNAVKIYGGFAGGETRLAQRTANGVVNGTFINQETPGSPMIRESSTVTARLDGFAFQGSDARAVVLTAALHQVEIANCFFFENSSGTLGGAIQTQGFGATLTLEDCVFVGNNVTGTGAGGGAVSMGFGILNVRRCIFIGNSVQATDSSAGAFGGAISAGIAAVLIEDSRFSNNVVRGPDASSDGPLHGGALAFHLFANVTIRNCTFENNEVDDNGIVLVHDTFFTPLAWSESRAGGGVALLSGAEADFLNCVFVGNRAPMFGGGLYVDPDSKAGVTNCTFHGNEAYPNLLEGGSPGDVIYVLPCEPTGAALTFTPIGVGGGIGTQGTVITDNSVFWDNIGVDTIKVVFAFLPLVDEPVSMEQQIATPPVGLPEIEPFGQCVTSAGTISYSHCAVKDNGLTYFTMNLFEGIGNINPEDPLFANAPGPAISILRPARR